MNVDNQTIVHVRATNEAPVQLLACILAKKPTAWGAVVQDVENDKPELAIMREDAKELGIDDLKTLMKNAKDRPLTMYFGNLKEGYHTDDIQPFVISDADDKPFFSIFVEGDIVGFDEPKEHTEQRNFADSFLIPRILEWCNDFDGDLDKITAKINGEIFNNDLLSKVGHRAVIHIVPVDGEVITLGKNELGEDADWGFTSQHHNYAAVKEQEPVKAADPPKNKFFSKKGSSPAAASPPAAPTAATSTATGGKVHDAATPGNVEHPVTGKAEGNIVITKPKNAVMRPPSWVHKNEDVKMFYQFTGGHYEGDTFVRASTPGNWKKRIPVDIKDPKVFEQASAWTKLDDMHKSMLKATATPGKTDTAAPLPPNTDVPVAPQELPEDNNLPVIPAKELEKILDIVAKLDDSSREIIDPKEMQELEKLHPKFSESTGAKPGEMLNWPVSGWYAIGKSDYRAVVMALLEFRALWRGRLSPGELSELTKRGEKVVTTETKIGTAGKKVESVVTGHKLAKEELKPAKPKGFFAKKSAA